MTSEFELGWIVALLDGEGCFVIDKKNNAPRISISMTDKDTIEKAALIMNVNFNKIRKIQSKLPNRKLKYGFDLCSIDAIKWMRIVKPYMSNRRANKINEIINYVISRRPHFELGRDFCKIEGHSIRYSWEYYLNINGGKACKRCRGVKVTPPIQIIARNLNHTPINPFNKKNIAS